MARVPTGHRGEAWLKKGLLCSKQRCPSSLIRLWPRAQIRHRLSRAGNRRLNHVLYIAAFVQLRHDTEGWAYYRRKLTGGKTPMEAMRCLKRRLSDAVYRQLVADSQHNETTLEAGPGGHSGATLTSSAADLTPHVGTSDQPQPEPAPATLPGPQPTRHPTPATARS